MHTPDIPGARIRDRTEHVWLVLPKPEQLVRLEGEGTVTKQEVKSQRSFLLRIQTKDKLLPSSVSLRNLSKVNQEPEQSRSNINYFNRQFQKLIYFHSYFNNIH